MGAGDVPHQHHVAQQGDGLQRLAETLPGEGGGREREEEGGGKKGRREGERGERYSKKQWEYYHCHTISSARMPLMPFS